jgi:hypothetical protein
MNRKTALERAFELADQGMGIREIRLVFQKEGYDQGQLYGSAVVAQLTKRTLAARGAPDLRVRKNRRQGVDRAGPNLT